MFLLRVLLGVPLRVVFLLVLRRVSVSFCFKGMTAQPRPSWSPPFICELSRDLHSTPLLGTLSPVFRPFGDLQLLLLYRGVCRSKRREARHCANLYSAELVVTARGRQSTASLARKIRSYVSGHVPRALFCLTWGTARLDHCARARVALSGGVFSLRCCCVG